MVIEIFKLESDCLVGHDFRGVALDAPGIYPLPQVSWYPAIKSSSPIVRICVFLSYILHKITTRTRVFMVVRSNGGVTSIVSEIRLGERSNASQYFDFIIVVI